MANWHPNDEPLLSPILIETRPRERLSLLTLLKIGGVLMLVTSAALLSFLSLSSQAETDPETAQIETVQASAPTSAPMVRLSSATAPDLIEPGAGRPEFMPPAEPSRWQMDLGRWEVQTEPVPTLPNLIAIDRLPTDRDQPGIASGIDASEADKNAQTEIEIETAAVAPAAEPSNMAATPSVQSPWTEELAKAVVEPIMPAVETTTLAAVDLDAASASLAPNTATVAPAPSAAPIPHADTNRPLIAIVIDDLGNSSTQLSRLLKLAAKPTLAFLPYPAGTPALAKRSAALGYEIFLHMPMQPEGTQDPGPDALLVGLSDEAIVERLRAAFARVPGAVGMNNHMGSAFTSDRPGMDLVLREVERRGLVFVDSRTTSTSVVPAAAALSGVVNTTRDIFLDHDPSAKAIHQQLSRLEEIARQYGSAVAIGHPYDNTIDALETWIPQALARGFRFAPVREIIAKRYCAKRPTAINCDPEIFVAELAASIQR